MSNALMEEIIKSKEEIKDAICSSERRIIRQIEVLANRVKDLENDDDIYDTEVVDSVARSTENGGIKQCASRQLEVFHSHSPQGRLQVVRTRATATTRWTNGTQTTTKSVVGGGANDFGDLQLSLNPLDLTSQKSKATVGRAASRRPPTRQRSKDLISDTSDPLRHAHITAATNLHRVSRLCHQIHESAVRHAFGNGTPPRPAITEPESKVEIYEIESVSSDSNAHTNLVRTKSSSSDDINVSSDKSYGNNKSVEDLDDLEQLQSWRRTSKIRRSLQYPKQTKPTPSKPLDLPENSVSVRKIKEDLEKGRRLNTALRNNSVDLEALDQILQSISSSGSDKASDDIENETPRKQKRNSFVTVESIQEVKGRLRRTSSPSSDIYKDNGKDDDPDDGIVTEDSSIDKDIPTMENSRVRSYVYGMEALLNKKPGIGTGSLESRVKLVNGNSTSKNEDWYNRRKSYGFEQVHNHENSTNTIAMKTKSFVESSTDSGICKSSEIVELPSGKKKNGVYNDAPYSSEDDSDSDPKYNDSSDKGLNGMHFGQVKKMAGTYSHTDKPFINGTTSDTPIWQKRPDWPNNNTELKSTTITIPIVKNNNIIDLPWDDDPEREMKRHSIAVDESKYVTRSPNEMKQRRTSLASNDQITRQDEDDNNGNRKTKKVEFCKTEVHFAADSGKVNIVATDEKPPPTQNFRRRRRNSGPLLDDFNKNGLPVLHFGDSSYEKSMFGVTDDPNSPNIYENLQPRVPLNFGLVTVNTNNSINNELSEVEDDTKELTDNEIKGILKNKPIKPKPYHLGETVPFSDTNSDEDNKWGIKLRHVEKPDAPIWKSTVTVHNYYEKQPEKTDDQPEFQKLLKNLRPTRRTDYTSDNDGRYLDVKIDDRRSSWSVSDSKKKQVDEGLEHRGYSTKINFGEGEATVVESDIYNKDRHPTWPRTENLAKDPLETVPLNDHLAPIKYVNPNLPTFSQVSLGKTVPTALRPDLKPSDQLSSPSLVGRNQPPETVINDSRHSPGREFRTAQSLHTKAVINDRYSPSKELKRSVNRSPQTRHSEPVPNDRLSPSKDYKSTIDKKHQTKQVGSGVVLRQPKKSEMTYFGVNISPKPVKKISQAVIRKESKLSDKPDLLQHHKNSPTSKKTGKPRQKTPDISDGPIYENVKNKYGREFDSSILDELTKAADQILQAVNGYTDEDSHNRQSTEEEDTARRKKEQLETIVEAKSWKQEANKGKTKPPNTKTKLKHTSSTSSVESLSRRRYSTDQKTSPNQSTPKKNPDKPESNNLKANTKARRLQRASSREALLQSHGSSSEDLSSSVETPLRKPRLVKKTKTMQMAMTNGLELKKSPTSSSSSRKKDDSRGEERILGSLPEIRHKTAVSTIRSTTDRSARERIRHKNEEAKKKTPQKREPPKVANSTCSRDRIKSGASPGKETVTHRISTANIKKCYRSEGLVRH